MRRRWKVLIVIGLGLAVLLTVNTIAADNQTKPAGVTIDGGQILHLTGGDMQVFEQGPERAQPIVLVHCYSCSLHWWDRLAPLLAEDHRVIRIDLLGFGGSQKPSTGYSMPEQAQAVAEALSKLQVQGAVVVGHSMGFDVATALAGQSSELVDRLVDIDEAPDESFGGVPFLARLGYVPVLGQAMWRITPSFVVKDSFGAAFAPGYDLEDGFDNPDQVVDDFRAMTYTSFKDSEQLAKDFEDQEPLDQRVRDATVPLLVIFGAEDQLWDDPAAAADAYRDVPGAEIQLVDGAGHSPNIEKPEETVALIEKFAAQAGYQPPPGPGRSRGRPARSANHASHHQHNGNGQGHDQGRGANRQRKQGRDHHHSGNQ
jgi:pimeloyl-ACP methyl ester carboxylesterase